MWKKVVLGFLLLVGLVLVGGYLVTGKQSTSESAVANASPESTASLAGPTSASVTADPMPTATQPLVASTAEPPVVSPSATPFDLTQDEPRTDPVEPTVEIATATPTADLPVAPVPGARAPDFTLTELNGDEVTLGELRGQVVLVNFWATWWPYCRSERSALQKAHEQYQDQGFVILSVDIGEGREVVQAFAQEQGLTFPILLDANGAVAQGYNVQGVPTSLFIDRDGLIQARYTGPMTEAVIEKHLDQIL